MTLPRPPLSVAFPLRARAAIALDPASPSADAKERPKAATIRDKNRPENAACEHPAGGEGPDVVAAPKSDLAYDRGGVTDISSVGETIVPSNRFSSLILFIAIAGAPLPFGSRDAFVVGFWCAVLGLGLIFASTSRLRRPHILFLTGTGLVVLGFAFVLHEQLADNPWIAAYHPIWKETADVLGMPIKPSVSIVRHEPFYALGQPAAAILALTLGVIVGADPSRARQALWVVACSGAAYAVFAISSLIVAPTKLLWRDKTAYIGDLTGTFVNRNTAAAYFGSCAAIWFLLLLQSVRRRLPRGPATWTIRLQTIGRALLQRKVMLLRLLPFAVCVLALLLTRSRAGVTISLFAMALGFAFQRQLQRGPRMAAAFVGAAAAAVVLIQIFGGRVSGRFVEHGLVGDGRLAAWTSTLRMIADHPWFGTGLGTFPWSFPAYRSSEVSMWGVWDRAHSTPLELAAEMGVPLAGAVVIGCIAILAILACGVRACKRRRLTPLAAFSVALIAFLHSCIDFPLQVTGFAIVAFGIAGVGVGFVCQDGPTAREYALPNSTRGKTTL